MYYLVKNTNEKHRLSRNERESQISFSDVGRVMTSSMEVVNEEHENFFQVFRYRFEIFLFISQFTYIQMFNVKHYLEKYYQFTVATNQFSIQNPIRVWELLV